MNFFNIKTNIRILANSEYYQTLFSYLRDGIPLKLFNNDFEFTDIQLMFLKYLSFYSTINVDVALGEVSDKILIDEIYCDSYMMYKNKNDKKKMSEVKNNNSVKESELIPNTRWLFNKSSIQNNLKSQVKKLEGMVKK
jgi:hypothetical protein